MPKRGAYNSISSAYGGTREENQLEGVNLKQSILKSEFKLVILGDSKVGKSALVQRLIDQDVFI
jgi:GTPase SAR1 family protein